MQNACNIPPQCVIYIERREASWAHLVSSSTTKRLFCSFQLSKRGLVFFGRLIFPPTSSHSTGSLGSIHTMACMRQGSEVLFHQQQQKQGQADVFGVERRKYSCEHRILSYDGISCGFWCPMVILCYRRGHVVARLGYVPSRPRWRTLFQNSRGGFFSLQLPKPWTWDTSVRFILHQ